jgi:YVTN family beta-propeller protein
MRFLAALSLAFLAAGCSLQARPMTTPAPLENEGEIYVYLRAFPREADRLSFTLTRVTAVKVDGTEVPLDLLATSFKGSTTTAQVLVATGRLPTGDYQGLLFTVGKASVERGSAVSDLQVPTEGARLDFGFQVSRRRAILMTLGLDYAVSIQRAPDFTLRFTAEIPARTNWQLAGFASNTGGTTVTVFDRRARVVTGIVPTGREPRGMAMEPRGNRLYVAVSGDDAVDVVDIAAGEVVTRINLGGNDRPRDLVLLADGKLLVINSGTRSASFVDPFSTQEVSRVAVGEEPWSLLLDRARQRAYVLNRRSNSMTVLDVGSRAVVGSVPTDPEPLWAQMNASGTRLYLVCAGSAFLTVFSVPDMTVTKRVHIGLGASALKVDPRTDQIYVGKRDDNRIFVYEPFGFLPIDEFEVSDPVSYMTIDDVDNTLFALVPDRKQVAVIDLTSRRTVSYLEVGNEPYQVTVSGVRY